MEKVLEPNPSPLNSGVEMRKFFAAGCFKLMQNKTSGKYRPP